MHQLSWREITGRALELLEQADSGLEELIPQALAERYLLGDLASAIRYLHRPPADAPQLLLQQGRHPAQRRLVFEELVAHQLSLRAARQSLRRLRAPVLAGKRALRDALIGSLPFELTTAQLRVVDEIAADLESSRPMLRLVQGDVGSGKTVVAALAALQALEAGWQVALMAPTELLAEQHLRSFRNWLEPLQLPVGWLSGRVKGKARERLLEALAAGEVPIVVGTQALFQEEVRYQRLGLIIVDEQHRFGVHQRLALRDKGAGGGVVPHQLIMTATPIPRSLAMTAYADLDLSVIDELPPGRTPVQTVVVSDSRREEVIERVRAACSQGRQAYWVCTLIEESESLQCQAAEETARQLAASLQDRGGRGRAQCQSHDHREPRAPGTVAAAPVAGHGDARDHRRIPHLAEGSRVEGPGRDTRHPPDWRDAVSRGRPAARPVPAGGGARGRRLAAAAGAGKGPTAHRTLAGGGYPLCAGLKGGCRVRKRSWGGTRPPGPCRPSWLRTGPDPLPPEDPVGVRSSLFPGWRPRC